MGIWERIKRVNSGSFKQWINKNRAKRRGQNRSWRKDIVHLKPKRRRR